MDGYFGFNIIQTGLWKWDQGLGDKASKHVGPNVKILVLYICVTHGPKSDIFGARFVSSYQQFPPGVEHETIIICNGGELSKELGFVFSMLNPLFLPRENDASRDIGGYIQAAYGLAKDAEMLVCLGESVYFHRAGWLKRLVNAWEAYGEGMYGIFASHIVRAHLNTTAFATAPKFLRDYPKTILNREDRYNFEHGPMAFWRWLSMLGKPTMLVTWDGVWAPGAWRRPANILWRGDQSNCLMWCNHVERYREMAPRVRSKWQAWCDAPFA